MRILIDGTAKEKLNPFFFETLSLLFCPSDNKFGEETGKASGNYINITAEDSYAKIMICNCGKIDVGSVEISPSEDYSVETAKLFYRIAQNLTGIAPPWGIYTGIRPARAADTADADALCKLYLMSADKAALAVKTNKFGRDALIRAGEHNPRDFSLYISVPFCPTRCHYCSFISYATPRFLKLIPDYLPKLTEELKYLGETVRERGMKLRTIYIGGGTPTTLTESQLDILCKAAADNFDIANGIEYTVECGRADTITREKLVTLKRHSVNRISINPQTLCDATLERIGRNHTAEQFYQAFALAREIGFDVINSDVIAGLPGDAPGETVSTVRKLAESLSPENITVHTFCVKKSARAKDDGDSYSAYSSDTEREVSECHAILESAGYIPYYMYRQKYTSSNLENTGYAKPATECMYNIYMMDEVHSIIAAGAGAVTKIVCGGKIERSANYKYPYEYIGNGYKCIDGLL
ncbi:hypothetical protein FACS1894219_07450 [Clostridia bacterium]|nr:hypothetical protein FACS1894219_07450 [Clostridia bacterium]